MQKDDGITIVETDNKVVAKMLNCLVMGENFINEDTNEYIYASLSQLPIKIINKNDSNDELNYTVECPNCGCYVNYGYQTFMRSGYLYCNNKGCMEKLEAFLNSSERFKEK